MRRTNRGAKTENFLFLYPQFPQFEDARSLSDTARVLAFQHGKDKVRSLERPQGLPGSLSGQAVAAAAAPPARHRAHLPSISRNTKRKNDEKK